jgi:tellurite resistance protein TerC
MPALIEITSWHWIGFIACVLVFLALDLGVFHREAHVVKFKEALAWTSLWFTLAMCFGAALVPLRGKQEAVEFLTGYIIEFSLSMDNVFVIALIFTHFRVPREYQHRVLFWGILGALVMRGVMIWGGVELIGRFEWLLYLLGGFLILSGLKMLAGGEEPPHPERNLAVRLARRLFPISRDYEGQRFITRVNGKLALTPMAIVLVMVETTDLIFAVDSIPAIFGVTRDAFIVFTSNVFAILGLRSLYFVLAGAIAFFRYQKVGLSLVLVFIGVKMVMLYWDVHNPTGWSLGFVVFKILM